MPTRAVARHGDADPLSVAIPWLAVAGPAISLRGVRKSFGSLTAVDGIDLEVPAGVCFGLLGPNGAGESTTMGVVTRQAIPDGGEGGGLGHPPAGQAEGAP